MVEPQGPAEVTLGTLHQDLSALRSEMREGFAGLHRELAGILREMAGSMREMITIQGLVLDELRGGNTRLDNFARGRGEGAPPA